MGNNGKIRGAAIDLLPILIMIVLLGAIFWWGLAHDRKQAEARKPTAETTLLPIVSGLFKQGRFLVYELEHGWIVGTGHGLTFVPKPPKQK